MLELDIQVTLFVCLSYGASFCYKSKFIRQDL